jgi:hypothetical protein
MVKAQRIRLMRLILLVGLFLLRNRAYSDSSDKNEVTVKSKTPAVNQVDMDDVLDHQVDATAQIDAAIQNQIDASPAENPVLHSRPKAPKSR